MTTRALVESKIRARTYAKGLLSALAHDLELSLVPSEATITEGEDGAWSGRLAMKVDAIRVLGVLRRGKLVEGVLSENDRGEIERRLREACGAQKTIVVSGNGRLSASGRAHHPELLVALGDRPPVPLAAEVTVAVGEETIELHAEGSISLRSLGIAEIKGPLGAFVVKDDVAFDAVLTLR